MTHEETWYVPPGSMATFELTLDKRGDYLLVDHALFRAMKGAVGVLHVTESPPRPEPASASLLVLAALAYAHTFRHRVRNSGGRENIVS